MNKQLKYLDEFIDLYKTRPIKNNLGGMGFNHSYSLYKILKDLNPSLVVESGVWKGHSTYIIEAALPKVKIVCLDLDFSRLEFKSHNAEYISDDFNNIDWSKYNDIQSALCFFDDHQNSLERLKEMRWWGFQKAIFEDNYPINEGDAYSIKQVMANTGHKNIQLSQDYLPSRKIERLKRLIEERVLNKYYHRQNMLVMPNNIDSQGLNYNIKKLQELPAVITNSENQWGKKWQGEYQKVDDLISEKDLINFPVFEKYYLDADKKDFHYYYMTFIELN